MSDEQGEAPKIIIDSDWKSQAQAEKDRLAAEEAEKEAAAPASGKPGELPPADFRSLVGMLSMQAVMYMGGVADKATGQAVFDPEASRHMIDLLGVLEEKTRGNLAEDESKELVGVVNELRARWVELTRLIAAQAAAGGAPGTPGAPGAVPPPPTA